MKTSMARSDRRQFLGRTAALLAVLGGYGRIGLSQETPRESVPDMLIPDAERAVKKGLDYLDAHQNEDGSLRRGRLSSQCSGSQPDGNGLHGQRQFSGTRALWQSISRCVGYLLEHAQESGYIYAPGSTSYGPMYGHGFATHVPGGSLRHVA